jgi:hypothetical protein
MPLPDATPWKISLSDGKTDRTPPDFHCEGAAVVGWPSGLPLTLGMEFLGGQPVHRKRNNDFILGENISAGAGRSRLHSVLLYRGRLRGEHGECRGH